MTGRQRLLTALNNEKPDRMPCQVHGWMTYYLDTYLNGMDQYEAYRHFQMDPVIYEKPEYRYNPRDLSNWDVKTRVDKSNGDYITYHETIDTPKGTLTRSYSENKYTQWEVSHIIKSEKDFEIWNEFVPVPESVDWTPVIKAKERIGENGIVRGPFYDFGQGSPWQSFAGYLYSSEDAIMATFDSPEWVHHVLEEMLKKKLTVIDRAGKFEFDLVETGGGAGSSTVISPAIHEEFCLPYDIRQHKAITAAGSKVVYHLCGGIMPLLDLVAQNGAHGLETMTPPEMGGDCDLAEASRRIGDKLFFIGGFDQNAGFEKGNPELVEQMVRSLFDSCQEGAYICSPSDHFFFGDPANIAAFVKSAYECVYKG